MPSTHEASAISRPDGEMVADPTRPSTWNVPSASKVSLSYGDLMILTFFGASESWSNTEGMVRTLGDGS